MPNLRIDTDYEFTMEASDNSIFGDESTDSSVDELRYSFSEMVFGWAFEQVDCQCSNLDNNDSGAPITYDRRSALPTRHRSLWRDRDSNNRRGRSVTPNETPSSCSRTLSPARRVRPVFIYEMPSDKKRRRERYRSKDRRTKRL